MTIIKIDKPLMVSEIKKTFSDRFPYLKIEFFKNKHKNLEGSLKKDLITTDFEIKATQKDNSIVFSETMLVSELEQQFAEKLKLSAQIFRKSGRTWLETTYTDSWSLEKQNEEGLALSKI
ncbi:MAG: hypothetical protein Q7W45_02730 [Bacteroidota bacterium]|nr:hypothetical protein [Bacteroidota bacterium]MDP3558465.1 hypothetical protein [Bacteroidota bacterium]